MTVQWIVLVPGLICICAGTAFVVFRRWLTKFISDSQRATFGKLADPLVQRAKPWQIAAAGIGGICLGTLAVVLAIFLPPYHPH